MLHLDTANSLKLMPKIKKCLGCCVKQSKMWVFVLPVRQLNKTRMTATGNAIL